MSTNQELQALREENRILKAWIKELLPLQEQLAHTTARIKELEDRLSTSSRTSSKPSSPARLGRTSRGACRSAGKRPGGQSCHIHPEIKKRWKRWAFGRVFEDAPSMIDGSVMLRYSCACNLCGAYLLRKCAVGPEQEQQA